MQKKEKQAVWLYPETKELMMNHLQAADARSQSEFIEKAIRFYSGYMIYITEILHRVSIALRANRNMRNTVLNCSRCVILWRKGYRSMTKKCSTK